MTPQTKLDEFLAIMDSDDRTNQFDKDELSYLFKGLLEKVIKRAEADKHHAERQQRRAVDALRSCIKRLEPPIRFDDSWENDVKPRVEKLEEYHAVETDELRRTAFDKVVRRLKEKYDADEQDRAREEHERKREREREARRRRDDRGYTRSPETDVYEADRRRAIADRERSYRRGSATGLSPPQSYDYEPRRRGDTRDRMDDRDYRDRERDRHDRGRLGGGSPYERERRVREVERERGYVSRADPRDVAKELDYGESGRAGSMAESTGTSRRRRSVDSDSRRDSKRLKTNGRSGSPQDAEMKEEVALQSGSEEGEIEEVDPKAVSNGKAKEEGGAEDGEA